MNTIAAQIASQAGTTTDEASKVLHTYFASASRREVARVAKATGVAPAAVAAIIPASFAYYAAHAA